jgi:nucleoside-diphosphate-sugar epimerase
MLKKVLITGANGFIGQHLVKSAIELPMEVYAGVRKGSNVDALVESGAKITLLDYDNVEALTQEIQDIQPNYIIHNAGLTRTPDYNAFLKVNRDYLIHLVQAIRQSKISLDKLLFVSSLAAYGPADFQPNGIVTNTSVPHPVTNYGRSKLAAESFLKAQTDIPYNIVRPTAVYGPGEKDLLNVFEMINNRINASVGFGKQQLTFIYVKDLVNIILGATTTHHNHKAYFAADRNIYTGQDFPNAIQKSLGKKAFSIKLPIGFIKIVAYISEKIGMLTGDFPTLYLERVHEIKARNWNCDTSELKADLDFKPSYTLEQAIDETVQWYKKNQWLQ